MSSLDYLDLCRLCLVKDRVSVPIFEGEGDVRQIFLKIAACLPVKVGREDKLPKKICDDCVYKVELFYQFWNTTANAEKQLLQWLGEVSMDEKQGYVTGAHDQNMMKPGQNTGENRLDGSSVMQQVNEHTNNMGMGMMDGMGIGMPLMIPNSGQQSQQQQMTSVPMDTGGNTVQNVQPVPGPSAQIGQQKINAPTNQDEDEEESEEEDNSDDECDGDDGLPVKEESEDEPNRTIEPTTFVNVSLACDEAGPSGLQQQKIGEMPEMVMPPTDGDPKSGNSASKAPSVAEIVITPRIFRSCLGRKKLKKHGSEKKPVRRKKGGIVSEEDCRRGGRSKERLKKKNSRGNSTEITRNNDRDESNERATLKCDHCTKKFGKKSNLIEHLKQHRYKCDKCPKTFSLVRYLDAHVDKVHHVQYYKCTVCDYESHNRSTLKTHFIRLHTSNYEFECDTCGKKFKIRKALNQHVKLYHLDTPPIVCDVCGHFSKNLHALKAHLRYRHYKPEFVCKICNRGMVTKENLEQHIDWHKTREKVLCPTCGKKFRSRDLESHMRVHTGIKPFACPVCGKNFRRQTAQEQHIVIHTGQRPYVCDICGQAFAQKPGLICHRKKHPGPLPPPPVISIKNIITQFLQEYSSGQFSE